MHIVTINYNMKQFQQNVFISFNWNQKHWVGPNACQPREL